MIGRAARRDARVPRVGYWFGVIEAEVVLDLLEMMELAWHDCYGEISPPESVIDDVLELSGGDVAAAVRAVRLAVTDVRDLRVALDAARSAPDALS